MKGTETTRRVISLLGIGMMLLPFIMERQAVDQICAAIGFFFFALAALACPSQK